MGDSLEMVKGNHLFASYSTGNRPGTEPRDIKLEIRVLPFYQARAFHGLVLDTDHRRIFDCIHPVNKKNRSKMSDLWPVLTFTKIARQAHTQNYMPVQTSKVLSNSQPNRIQKYEHQKYSWSSLECAQVATSNMCLAASTALPLAFHLPSHGEMTLHENFILCNRD